MPSKGYLLGKLFAQLEYEGVVRSEQYHIASMSPTSEIVPAFARLAEIGKMDSILEVMNEIPMDSFDGQVLSSEDQADFPLGYYQEKVRRLRATEQPEEEERFIEQLLVRLEPSLKKWVMEHGGSKLVRTLLRAERERLSK